MAYDIPRRIQSACRDVDVQPRRTSLFLLLLDDNCVGGRVKLVRKGLQLGELLAPFFIQLHVREIKKKCIAEELTMVRLYFTPDVFASSSESDDEDELSVRRVAEETF